MGAIRAPRGGLQTEGQPRPTASPPAGLGCGPRVRRSRKLQVTLTRRGAGPTRRSPVSGSRHGLEVMRVTTLAGRGGVGMTEAPAGRLGLRGRRQWFLSTSPALLGGSFLRPPPDVGGQLSGQAAAPSQDEVRTQEPRGQQHRGRSGSPCSRPLPSPRALRVTEDALHPCSRSEAGGPLLAAGNILSCAETFSIGNTKTALPFSTSLSDGGMHTGGPGGGLPARWGADVRGTVSPAGRA